MIGIPDGEDKTNYINIGKIETEGVVGRQGDTFVYIKVLERPTGTWVDYEEDQVRVVYPSMPDPPERFTPIGAPRPIRGAEIIEDTTPEPDTPTPEPMVVGEEPAPEKKKREWGDIGDMLGPLAAGLMDARIEGINIGVPTFGQPVYESGQLGPAVQNLFRKGN